MAKIVLEDTNGGYNIASINRNFQKLQAELNNKVLYRLNDIPFESNAWLSNMDANGKRIYNLPEPVSSNEAARLKDVQNGISGLVPANLIPFTPVGSISSDTVQGAIQEVQNDQDAANAGLLSLINTFIGNLASAIGSTFVGFKQAGAGSVIRDIQSVLREQHSVWDFYSASDATHEGMINRAIAAHNRVYLPAGIYQINAAVGISVRTGTVIMGDGKNKTILNAVQGTGGTLSQLASYSTGSVIKRSFNPLGTNSYVNDGYIGDIGIVLNHPQNAITTTALQIGFDMRNITGFTVERCHVGNIPPVGGPIAAKMGDKSYLVQGYPVVFGNVSGSDPAYAGGEKNRFINNSVYGGYKCVVQDEVTLSPSSASYATIINDNDIQTGHWLIAQMGQYGAGNLHYGNILQDIQKRNGDVSPSYIQYYDGYNNNVRPAYIEGGSNVDYQLYLDTDSNNNDVNMLMAGNTSGAGLIQDASNLNSYNRITHHGLQGVGALVELYNKANKKSWVRFHWNGSAIVIDGSNGVASVTRGGVGDYLITWETAFPTAHYNISNMLQTNPSTNAGVCVINTITATNVRISTSIQVGATTTIIDPTSVWVGVNQ